MAAEGARISATLDNGGVHFSELMNALPRWPSNPLRSFRFLPARAMGRGNKQPRRGTNTVYNNALTSHLSPIWGLLSTDCRMECPITLSKQKLACPTIRPAHDEDIMRTPWLRVGVIRH